jgi:hypothetical protein
MLDTLKLAPPMALWSFFCTAGPYDIHSFVDVAPYAGVGGVQDDRPAFPRPWHDVPSFKWNVPAWLLTPRIKSRLGPPAREARAFTDGNTHITLAEEILVYHRRAS